jgi:hypothetical protein
MMLFIKTLIALSLALTLAGCGADFGARLGPYGTRAGVNVGEATPPPPVPGSTALPPPLPR